MPFDPVISHGVEFIQRKLIEVEKGNHTFIFGKYWK